MKKMISMVFAMVVAMGSMNAQSRVSNVKMTAPFNKIQVSVAGHIQVVDGHMFGVNVRTNDKDLENDIELKVENGVLNITSKSGAELTEEDKLKITIITPNNPTVETGICYESKACDKAADLDAENENDLLPNAPQRPFFGFPRAGRHFGMPHFSQPMHPFAHRMSDKANKA